MDQILAAMKWFSQLLIVGTGVSALYFESYKEDPETKHRTLTPRGWMTVCGVIVGFVVFAGTDFIEQGQKKAEAASAKKELEDRKRIIDAQQETLGYQKLLLDKQDQELNKVRNLDLARWTLSGVRVSWRADQRDLSDFEALLKKGYSRDGSDPFPASLHTCLLDAADTKGWCSVEIHGSAAHDAFITYQVLVDIPGEAIRGPASETVLKDLDSIAKDADTVLKMLAAMENTVPMDTKGEWRAVRVSALSARSFAQSVRRHFTQDAVAESHFLDRFSQSLDRLSAALAHTPDLRDQREQLAAGSARMRSKAALLRTELEAVQFSPAGRRPGGKVTSGFYDGVDDSYWQSVVSYLSKRLCRDWTLLSKSSAELLRLTSGVLSNSIVRIGHGQITVDVTNPGFRLDQIDEGPVTTRFNLPFDHSGAMPEMKVHIESIDPAVHLAGDIKESCALYQRAAVSYTDEKGTRGFAAQCSSAPT
jgi:hypothetical protein